MKPGRMDSVKRFRRDTAWKRFCRWLGGDWWMLETDTRGAWGVWHPWRHHRWENYVFTKEEAEKEAKRLNSGRHYEICKNCGTTFASHHNGTMGGLRCPTMLRHNARAMPPATESDHEK